MPLDPHSDQPVLRKGPQPRDARLSLILVHGRGASAANILTLADDLAIDDVAYLAPQASENTWYPFSFLSPIPRNEPGITSGLGVLARLIAELEAEGVPVERVGLVGFSQGACLSLEFAARQARRYAGVGGLSGGLIGPPETPRHYPGSMAGTPVLLGCSDIDPHIPLERVQESATVFRQLGADVDARIYPQMGHIITGDEIDALRKMFSR